jgi:hypothetical protein
MTDRAVRHRLARAAVIGPMALGLLGVATTAAPHVRADLVAYLVNVTVRPGYDFASAENALAYGDGICDKVSAGRTYAKLVRDIENDFHTADELQASYLITQAVNELCPALIWQLRATAAHYRPTGAVSDDEGAP